MRTENRWRQQTEMPHVDARDADDRIDIIFICYTQRGMPILDSLNYTLLGKDYVYAVLIND